MQIRRWVRFIVLGSLLAILMAVTIASSALAQECIDPVTKKVIPCPAADGGGGGNKKPTPSPYPSFTPTSTNTPTATATAAATLTASPTSTPDGLAVGKVEPGQPAPQAPFDKKNLFGPIAIGSLLVILIGLLLPGLRRSSTKASPDAPPPGMGSPGNGKGHGFIPELTKDQRHNLLLLQRFFDAARQGEIGKFIESEEVRRFLHDAKRGVFGGKVPDGTPGSEFPGTGAEDPLDVLGGLFHGPAFDLGRIDHSGSGGDPAELPPAPDGVTILPNGTRQTIHTDSETGDRVTIWTHTNGAIRTWISHSDGSADGFLLRPDGSAIMVHVSQTPGNSREMGAGVQNGTVDEVNMIMGANSREVVTTRSHHVNNSTDYQYIRSIWRRGQAPGEDGRDGNTARNPLNNLDVIGPRSTWEMTESLRHPGGDAEQHDPNTGEAGRPLTDAERERLGRIVPAAELLDPNSGIDPLTGLHIDPSQLHSRSEDDDRIDPNTGEQPLPGGG